MMYRIYPQISKPVVYVTNISGEFALIHISDVIAIKEKYIPYEVSIAYTGYVNYFGEMEITIKDNTKLKTLAGYVNEHTGLIYVMSRFMNVSNIDKESFIDGAYLDSDRQRLFFILPLKDLDIKEKAKIKLKYNIFNPEII